MADKSLQSDQCVVNGGVPAFKGVGIGKIHVFGGLDEILNANPSDPEDKEKHLRKIFKNIHKKFQALFDAENNKPQGQRNEEQVRLAEAFVGMSEGREMFIDALKGGKAFLKQPLHVSLRQMYDQYCFDDKEAHKSSEGMRDFIVQIMSEHSGVSEDVGSVPDGSILVAGAVGVRASIDIINHKKPAGVISSESSGFHLLMLCKEHGIPALAESDFARDILHDPDLYERKTAVLDTFFETGRVIVSPVKEVSSHYKGVQKKIEHHRDRQKEKAFEPCMTKDGTYVSIWGNRNDLDFESARSLPIDGIGLLRLESLFASYATQHELIDSKKMSSQFTEACSNLDSERPVTVRFLDINGNDKSAGELLSGFQKDMAVTHDENGQPIIGAAFLLKNQGLLEMQIKSIVQAHASHPQRFLIPYVNKVNEVKQIRKIVENVHDEMKKDGFVGGVPPLYSMIETEKLCRDKKELEKVIKESDGVSIGGNDLSCELAGIERYESSSKTKGILPIYNPEFIRALSDISALSMKHGKEVSMCGDCASDVDFVPILVAQGIKLSVLGDLVYDVRDRIMEIDVSEAKDLEQDVLKLKSSKAVYNRVHKFAKSHSSGLDEVVDVPLDFD